MNAYDVRFHGPMFSLWSSRTY